MNPIDLFISIASSFIGVTEKGGDNKGEDVEAFQKVVDGKAQGEAWCMCFVQFCLYQTEDTTGKIHGVWPSEHCITVWNATHPIKKFSDPEPGDIVIWQFHENSKPTTKGHTGIVLSVNKRAGVMETVEGNTGDGSEVVREGDGVYKKVRYIKGSDTMKVLGFIRPF